MFLAYIVRGVRLKHEYGSLRMERDGYMLTLRTLCYTSKSRMIAIIHKLLSWSWTPHNLQMLPNFFTPYQKPLRDRRSRMIPNPNFAEDIKNAIFIRPLPLAVYTANSHVSHPLPNNGALSLNNPLTAIAGELLVIGFGCPVLAARR